MITDHIKTLSPSEQAIALNILDRISRPLSALEIDVALAKAGVSRTHRKPLISVLKHLAVVVIVRDAD